jgi:hypothetical protein
MQSRRQSGALNVVGIIEPAKKRHQPGWFTGLMDVTG